VTGFGFPIVRFTPVSGSGLSRSVLAVAIFARYARRTRRDLAYGCISSPPLIALYLNFLVLIVQSFQKVPALKTLAPTQSEPPFVIAQVAALAVFIALGVLAAIRFREVPVGVS